MSELIQKLQWRYAAKKMEAGKVVPQDKVERILEAARLAPTSSGLQPYEIIVIRNAAVREQIKAVANKPEKKEMGFLLFTTTTSFVLSSSEKICSPP